MHNFNVVAFTYVRRSAQVLHWSTAAYNDEDSRTMNDTILNNYETFPFIALSFFKLCVLD